MGCCRLSDEDLVSKGCLPDSVLPSGGEFESEPVLACCALQKKFGWVWVAFGWDDCVVEYGVHVPCSR